MATSGSQSASRKTNGVIAVSGQQGTATEAPKSSRSRAPVEGHKVVIRRLPPGLTEEELWSKLGEEWKAGQGLVSWHNFEPGKIQTDPAKISKPARLYLHVLKRENLSNLSNLIQAKSWEDAKMSSNNPCLVGPPILEYASYPKIPSAKKRSDPRQGTIDQDPEFMAFLQSLTNPDQDKEAETGENKEAEEPKAETKVTTTPLIEYLKEKKANKAKEAAAAKSAKQSRQESQSTKGKASASTTEDTKKGKKESKSDKSADKPKETVKILTKKATADAVKAAETVASQITQSSSATQEVPKSRRAGIAAAARILQRDLGISPGSAHRRARLDAAKAEAEAKATASKEPAQPVAEKPAPAPPAPAPPAPSSSNTAQTSERNAASSSSKSGRTRRGGGSKNASSNEKGKSNEAGNSSNTPAPPKAPVVLLKKKDEEKNKDKAERAERAEKAERADKADKDTSASASQSAPSKSNPPTGPKGSGKGGNSKKGGSSSNVSTGATRGFVKHANPSQGVTEALLKQAMEAFGTVTFVEIDKRKGFAYVDFSNHDGLAKAIAASPITVAQGTVQVLERKEKKPAAGNSNSNANAGSSSSAPAAAASASESKSNKDKEKDANAPEKTDEPRHKRTRRGRGSGKSGANKDAQQGGDKGAGAAAG
ncbi:nonsense-mediated mRNA decay protein [Colletotrichum plurivorum]|uniref:Nonsense-mediated mRNA decay protein n=1 Tax=Colletotrichum plurivorum TaxID=2175906 RepID=A0A8H6KES7_9PEZI|nr:nonsense-mediated mRNA decay protein [Colletotrichum plurivorum]